MTERSDYVVRHRDNGVRWNDALLLNINVKITLEKFNKSLFQDHLNYFNKNTVFAVNGCAGYNPYR